MEDWEEILKSNHCRLGAFWLSFFVFFAGGGMSFSFSLDACEDDGEVACCSFWRHRQGLRQGDENDCEIDVEQYSGESL